MKTRLKHLSKTTISVLMSLMIIVSATTVGIVATDAAKTAEESISANDNSEVVGFTGTNTVYFKNTQTWTSVYVYFYSAAYWDYGGKAHGGSKGTCVAGPHQMTHFSGSGANEIFSYTYTADTAWTHIAFTQDSQSSYDNFYETKVVPCNDDYTVENPMCVPGSTTTDVNSCKDYDYSWDAVPETTYSVTVSAGTGGKVSIDSGTATASSQTVDVGTITLANVQAVPDPGYSFTHWDVTGSITGVSDDDTTNPIVGMGATGASGTLTANFEKVDLTVTAATGLTGGSISVDSTTKQIGDTVTVTATPQTGYSLSNVTYTANNVTTVASKTAGKDNEYTFTMPGYNTTVSATFGAIGYTVVKSAAPDGYGSVSVKKTDASGAEVSEYNIGDTLYLSATTSQVYYEFVDFTVTYGDDTTETKANGTTIDMTGKTGNITVQGNFKAKDYTITYPASDTGYTVSGTPDSGTETKTYGQEGTTFTVTPAEGYDITEVSYTTGGDKIVLAAGENNTYKVASMPASDIAISVTAKQRRTITVDVDDHAQVRIAGSSAVGQNKTFTADGTFIAYVGDVITFTASGQSSTYDYDSLTCTGAATAATITDNTGSVSVGASDNIVITATSRQKTGYYFYVNAGTGANATVAISSGNFSVPAGTSSVTVATGTRQKFVVGDESATVTITSGTETGYDSAIITKVTTEVSSGATVASPASVSSTDNGATYFVTAGTPAPSGTEGEAWLCVNNNSSNSQTPWNSISHIFTQTGQSGHYYAIVPRSYFSGTSVVRTAYSSEERSNFSINNEVSAFWNDVNDTYSGTVASGSTDYLNASQNNYGKSVFGEVSFKNASNAGKYDVLVDVTNNNDSITYTYSIINSGGADLTSFDTYYLGGRFEINDSELGSPVYSGEHEGDWQGMSVKMPFTLTSTANVYKLETNRTIAELSGLLAGKSPHFVVHNKKKYILASTDNAGLNFQNNTASNKVTVAEASSLTLEKEFLFNDTETNSDGMVDIYFDATNKQIWYQVEHETSAVAGSVALATKVGGVDVTNTTVGEKITLEATASGINENAGTLYYTFYMSPDNGETWIEIKSESTSNTCEYTETHVRSNIYKVVVTESTGTFRNSFAKKTVQHKNKNLYRTTVDLNDSSKLLCDISKWRTTAIVDGQDHYWTQNLSAGQSFEFAIANAYPTSSKDTSTLETNRVDDFYIDQKLTRYCDIEARSITVSYTNGEDEEKYTVRTYKVTPRTNCSNPVIHIDATARFVKNANGETVYYPGSIYAVATYAETSSYTMSNTTETVTYYFAEATSDPNLSKTGEGVRIAYWNNSMHAGDLSKDATNGFMANATKTDVTTAVNVGGSNTITIDTDNLYSSGLDVDEKTFNVYSVNLPIWATSFAFLDTNDTPISTRSIKKEWGSYDYGSLLLNPNRVYLLYQDTNTNHYKYTKGVVLDKGLWDSGVKNNPDTKTFKSNVINYNKTYSGDSVNNNFNEWLEARAYGSFTNNKALYFGYFNEDAEETSFGLDNFKFTNNLAMRNTKDNDYFASIKDLVAEKLDTDNLNSNGFPLLETYTDTDKHNKVNMPLFDYAALTADKSNTHPLVDKQYLGVDFPMYESSFNGITTYSYDSSTDKNRSIKDGNFIIGDYEIAAADLGYKPFVNDNSENKDNADRNLGNATELDVEFFMSNTGSIKDSDGNNHDITFNFTGDDDVWVYVDGVLVLDLGGSHKASAGTINFTDMKVYYKTAAEVSTDAGNVKTSTWAHDSNNIKTIDLKRLFEANGVNFNNKDGNTKHTFQMFYMERGAIDSNMSVSFNLPQASGLNIKNEVTANNVNAGLKEAALYAANGDSFTYGVSAALASGSMYGNAVSTYSGANNNSAAAEAINSSEAPKYPANTNTNRVFTKNFWKNGSQQNFTTTYPLSRTTESADGAQYEQSREWQTLNNVTYALSDAYLAPVQEGETALDVAGKTDRSGEFHLLSSQTATFDDKVTPHSFVKVYQDAALGKVDYTDGSTPIGHEAVADNAVSNYYITSYSIYDDHSATWIKPKNSGAVNSADDIYAADNSANENMFYFSDYAKAADSSAMTVTFYNDIAVGDIRISKAYNGDKNTKFYYDVTFANLFGSGDTNFNDLVAYNMITYDVVDTASGAIISRGLTYGTTGIELKGGQTAVISGVPVETRYQVTERAKSGTTLKSIVKTIAGPDGEALAQATPTHGYAESFDAMTIADQGIRGTSNRYETNDGGDKYYYNMIPRVSESYKSGAYKTTSYVAFTNEKSSVKIVFNYYDRGLASGSPATISSDPTSYIVNSSLSDELNDVTGDNERIKTAFKEMIEAAAVEFQEQALTQNVVDDYVMWSSLEDAIKIDSGIGSLTNIYANDGNGALYKDAANFNDTKYYHTNSLSQPLGQALRTDGAKWVSYKKDSSYVDAESFVNGSDALEVNEINVWLYNTPHQYNVNIYGVKSSADLGAATTAKLNGEVTNIKVANVSNTSSKLVNQKVYYNQRLGMGLQDNNIDSSAYISHYNQPGYRSDIEPVDYITRDTFTDSTTGKKYRFAYWAYDPAGQVIASTNAYYYYRITNDTNLYAVYSEVQLEDITNAGLTIYNNRNDKYVDSKGVSRTRLNIMFNPYACEDNDKNLQQTAMVYINLSEKVAGYSDADVIALFNAYRDQLDDILKAKAISDSFTSNDNLQFIKTSDESPVSVTLTTKGFVRNAKATATGFTQVTPTAKNRVQYTLSVKTSSLNDTKLMIIGAMYYNGNYEQDKNHWKISDNCLYYVNGVCKSLDFGQ